MNPLYPLVFDPVLKDKIWGGDKLMSILHKKSGTACGESWELSGIPGSESVVANGPLAGTPLNELVRVYGSQLLGSSARNIPNAFPLLLKFLDAREDLSIQVHPNDEQSGGLGKTEAWYILQADAGAYLYSGFNRPVTEADLKNALHTGKFMEYMNRVPVQAGDVFFIEANQVHTIGAGILLAEIQQPSDVTYRVYDFDRVDDKGNKRELHLEDAFRVMRLSEETGKVKYSDGDDVPLVQSPYFNIQKKRLTAGPITVSHKSFEVWMCIEGDGALAHDEGEIVLMKGSTVLLPPNNQSQLQSANQLEVLSITL